MSHTINTIFMEHQHENAKQQTLFDYMKETMDVAADLEMKKKEERKRLQAEQDFKDLFGE